LKCENKACPKKYHRELPDIIIPYKRYSAESIEGAIDPKNTDVQVAAEESTIHRWREWFNLNALHIMMALLSVAVVNEDNAETSSLEIRNIDSKNPIKTIKSIFKVKEKWLNKTVRILVNSAKWNFNRSAFLTKRKRCTI
jgi:hypothetical protein